MPKWPLVREREREQRCKLLEYFPEEHGNTRKDAESSLQSDHGLIHSFRPEDWYIGKKSSQPKYLERRK